MPGSTHLEPYKRLDEAERECARERERRMELERDLRNLRQAVRDAIFNLDGPEKAYPALAYSTRGKLQGAMRGQSVDDL